MEDVIKDSGEVRCRWVLREFATTPGDSKYYATTPSKTAVEILHAHAVQEGNDLVYFDLTRAFMHAPETRVLYTSPAVGYGDPKKEARLLVRKITVAATDARSSWSGSRRCRRRSSDGREIHSSQLRMFMKDRCSMALHIDDGVIEGPNHEVKEAIQGIRKRES